MNAVQHHLIKEARQRYKTIYPCGLKTSLRDCFTRFDNAECLWFNTPDNTTHVIVHPHGGPEKQVA